MIEAFYSNYSWLDRNEDVVDLLLTFMTNSLRVLPLHLYYLYTKLSYISLQNLWYSFFPKELTALIYSDLLYAQQITAKIIRLALATLHLLWLKCCKIVHYTLDGETRVNHIIELKVEVRDILQEPDY